MPNSECVRFLFLFFVTNAGALTWYPKSSQPMFGEQIDLVGADNISLSSNQTESVPLLIDGLIDSLNPNDSGVQAISPEARSDPGDHDREPFDEVENIEPRQWSHIFPTSATTARGLFPQRRATSPTTLAQRNPSSQGNPSVNAPPPPPTASVDEVFCDFGPLPVQSLCEWQDGHGALRWTTGTGLSTNWLGGPPIDSTAGTMEGGYAFLETSHVPPKDTKSRSHGGLLHSPQLGSTGVSGTCFMFKYAINGLSSAGLRVLLHMGVDEFSIKKDRAEEIPIENVTATATSTSSKPFDSGSERVLWHAQYNILGVWQQAHILYTYPELHSLVIEGVPVDSADPSRLYRGYIAIDDIDLQIGPTCAGFCNFAGGICDWTNDAEDDFDWTISRGSNDPTTGPAMDSSSDRATAGGYAYIDSRYPRRPGDIARLMSISFPGTGPESPMCMHFWFHMFGSGIGNLKIYLRHLRSLDAEVQEIWALSGNAGNAWFKSEVTISSLDDYQLIFEASVGNTGMGDIAIDEISLTSGVCPTIPQVAAPVARDCTFEIDECEWVNSRDPDRVEWERISTSTLSSRNQRKPYSNGHTVSRRNEYFLGLQRSRGGGRNTGGGTAQLMSREFKGSDDPLCITFWYFMFESFIDSTGPSLGVLRVLVQTLGETSSDANPVWQLYNNQGPTWSFAQTSINERKDFNIIFEGTWGPNRASGSIAIDDVAFYTGNCTVRPMSAIVKPEDCSFEKGLCGWENKTSAVNDRTVTWQRAFLTHRPAQLLDKTFGATGDFVFFDIFTTNQKSATVQLLSPVINISPDETALCFTFWFAAFGVEESTSLRIIKVSVEGDKGSDDEESEDKELLWHLTAKGFNNIRPSWVAAQFAIEARAPYRLILEGTASNGGFAIDDIKFQPEACMTRPAKAQPATIET